MIRFLLILFLTPSLFVLGKSHTTNCTELPNPQSINIKLHKASTPRELAWGFTNVRSLEENEGKLFIFPKKQKLSFWMFSCYLDLDLAFLDNNLIIKELHKLSAYPEKMDSSRPITSIEDINNLYPPGDPIRLFFSKNAVRSHGAFAYALELPCQFFEHHQAGYGWTLNLPNENLALLFAPISLPPQASDTQSFFARVSPYHRSISFATTRYYAYELSENKLVIAKHDMEITNSFIKNIDAETLVFIPKKNAQQNLNIKVGDKLNFD